MSAFSSTLLAPLPAVHVAGQEPPQALSQSPLPGGVAAVVRFLFHVPQWIQIWGAVLGGLSLALVLVLVWTRRRRIWGRYLRARRVVQLGLGLTLAGLAVGSLGFGRVSWKYIQHDNDFCTGCHLMDTAYSRFTLSRHADLSCHECHRQSILASSRQLYLWVLDRPTEIGKHASVPDEICSECHITEDPDSTWQRISATAGHRVHLDSDSSALADLTCVTCHGRELHRFVPADQTCGQDGCHAPGNTRIVLGKMSGQTDFHCTMCHDFSAPVSEEAPPDTAAAHLAPGRSQCFVCHDMAALLADFEPVQDPHDGKCGECHEPHRQETPPDAFATCADEGCHARADTLTPLHRGLSASVLNDCGRCHAAHDWLARGGACLACHADIERPPAISAEAVSPTLLLASGRLGSEPTAPVLPASSPSASAAPGASQAVTSFDHRTHRKLACGKCHSNARSHGEVRVRTRAQCDACHHRPPAVDAGCESCHGPDALPDTLRVVATFTLGVWKAPTSRRLGFRHSAHRKLECGNCHTEGRRLAAGRSCAECHADHHGPDAACAACHSQPPETAHPMAVHVAGCSGSGCHQDPAYGAIPQTRNLCLACHQDQKDHEPGESCARCHLTRPRGAIATGGGP